MPPRDWLLAGLRTAQSGLPSSILPAQVGTSEVGPQIFCPPSAGWHQICLTQAAHLKDASVKLVPTKSALLRLTTEGISQASCFPPRSQPLEKVARLCAPEISPARLKSFRSIVPWLPPQLIVVWLTNSFRSNNRYCAKH